MEILRLKTNVDFKQKEQEIEKIQIEYEDRIKIMKEKYQILEDGFN